VDAIAYVTRTGCSWRQLPRDFPPWQTVYWHFARWEDQGVTEQILQVLRRRLRRDQGRAPDPSAAVMDTQSVKGADTVGRHTRGCDAHNYLGWSVMPGGMLNGWLAGMQPAGTPS
jgi:transposase